MKPSQITTAIKTLLPACQPLFIWGAPGVGKSQVVAQTAAALNLELIDIRAILLDPVDLRGLPHISEGRSKWCPPSFLPQKGEGILFLDELNAAPPLVQASCYQLVLDRCLGEYQLPDGWMIIAAGNRESDRAVTHRMPSALANRFVHIDFVVDVEEWLEWAKENSIAEEVRAFLRFRPKLLHNFQPEIESKAFASPRSWEFASKIIQSEGLDKSLRDQLLEGTVGIAATRELQGFLRIWQQLPSVQEVLDSPQNVIIPSDPAILYALCEMVGQAVKPMQSEKLILFAHQLPEEFSILLMREAVRHCSQIAASEPFGHWAACHSEVLVR